MVYENNVSICDWMKETRKTSEHKENKRKKKKRKMEEKDRKEEKEEKRRKRERNMTTKTHDINNKTTMTASATVPPSVLLFPSASARWNATGGFEPRHDFEEDVARLPGRRLHRQRSSSTLRPNGRSRFRGHTPKVTKHPNCTLVNHG